MESENSLILWHKLKHKGKAIIEVYWAKEFISSPLEYNNLQAGKCIIKLYSDKLLMLSLLPLINVLQNGPS